MNEILKEKLINKSLDLGLFLGQSAARIINEQADIIERDYHSSLAMIQDTGDKDSEDYLSIILEAHMDTLVKSVINIVVASITEKCLEENGTPVDLPDIVQYIISHKEEYNLN